MQYVERYLRCNVLLKHFVCLQIQVAFLQINLDVTAAAIYIFPVMLVQVKIKIMNFLFQKEEERKEPHASK